MRELGQGLWVHEPTVKLVGFSTRLRTTILRLSDGSLWVHSPTPLTPQLRAAVEQLGPVRYVVAANNHHNRWLLEWAEAYPRAHVCVSRGIPAKLRGLRDHWVLEDMRDPPWRTELAQAFNAGAPFFSETVFFHRSTRSLVVTDFVQNHREAMAEGPLARWTAPIFARLGFNDVCLAPPLRLRLIRKDEAAFRSFVAQILAWDFARIIVTHGAIVEHDAHDLLTHLCARLAGGPGARPSDRYVG